MRLPKFLPVIGAILLVIITLSSTAVGAIKVKDSINKSKELSKNIQIPEVLGEQEVGEDNLDESMPSPTSKSSVSPTSKPKPSSKIANKTNTQTATTSLSNQCIITLFGQKYDVTELRATHSGGDVFLCGTDMTSTYQSRHGTNLAMMEKYKVSSSPTSAPSATAAPTTAPVASNPSNRCIITLFGAQYDVTQLRATHSGGDIFRCGTDMTSTYQSRHGTNLAMMEKYRITQTQPGIPQPTSTPTRAPRREEEDDRDDD